MRKPVLACLAALFAPLGAAQDTPNRFLLEAGIVGGNSSACPGRYVGLNGRIAGPVSLYGMVENYRCADLAGTANRVGASALVGRSSWLVRPELRAGIEYDGGDVSPTTGASLTFGRRYGARFILHVGDGSGGTKIVLFQMGAFFSF